tara:strand:- start:4034 stop:4987 length:954 start_codon:yes stop_codon:yes gene_type:complete
MNLYKVDKQKLIPIEPLDFKLERNIQNLIEANTRELFSLEFVSSEFTIGEFRLDSLCFDEESNSFVIVEYKKGSSYSVIDQGYSYLSTMLNNKADFILEYNESMASSIKKSDVDWSASRVIFVSPSFNSYQKNSVNFKDVPFELWEIQGFNGDLISLKQHRSTSKESIKKFAKNNQVIDNVSSEVKVYREEDVIAKSNESIKLLWNELKERLSALSNVEFVPNANSAYIKFTKNAKGVCYFSFKKQLIKGEIIRGNIYPDGKKSKNFFVIDDPKDMCKDYNFTYKSGIEGHRYLFDISNDANLDYIEMLIKQKYNQI